MVGRTFFALVQTFFSVAPALVYLVAGNSDLSAGHDRRVHDAPDAAALPDRPDAADLGRGAVVARAVRADLPVPRPRARDRRRRPARRRSRPARSAARSRCATCGSATRSPSSYDVRRTPRRTARWTLEDVTLEVAARAAGGDRRPERRRQDHDLVPDPAPLRPIARPGRARRPRRPRPARSATLAGAIGMVTQETYLFHATVRENLLYARPEATEAEMEAAARAARSTTASSSSRTATTPSSASAATACRAARSSGSRSPGSS